MFAFTSTLASFPLLAVVTSLVPIYSVLNKCLGYGLSSKVPKRKKKSCFIHSAENMLLPSDTETRCRSVCIQLNIQHLCHTEVCQEEVHSRYQTFHVMTLPLQTA